MSDAIANFLATAYLAINSMTNSMANSLFFVVIDAKK